MVLIKSRSQNGARNKQDDAHAKEGPGAPYHKQMRDYGDGLPSDACVCHEGALEQEKAGRMRWLIKCTHITSPHFAWEPN
jgi:hypothetical protein